MKIINWVRKQSVIKRIVLILFFSWALMAFLEDFYAEPTYYASGIDPEVWIALFLQTVILIFLFFQIKGIDMNKLNKNNVIDSFNWASLKLEQTILQVDGPFVWAKLFFYLSAIRLPFVFVSILFNNALLIFDFLIAVPLVYGQWQRKKWAWYLIMLNFVFYPFVPILLYEESGIPMTLISIIIAIPNLIYFWKRSQLYNVKQKDIDNIKTKAEVYSKVVKKLLKEQKIDKKISKSVDSLKSKAINVTKDISKSLNLQGTPTEKLKELKSLFDDGIITEKEFEEKKAELLKKF